MHSYRADPEEAREFLARHPDIRHIHLLHTDHNGIQRGKALRPDELLSLYTHGKPLPSSSAALTLHGDDVEGTGLLWEVGDADCQLFPVAGTLVRCPWLPGPTAQVQVMLDPELGLPSAVIDPRLAAARIVEGYASRGLRPVVAVELEFYLLHLDSADERPPRPVAPRGLQPHIYAMEELESIAPFLDDVYRACDAQGLPAETALSEFGAGQFEITLSHRADALRALDDGVMFKRLIKGVAQRHGYLASFMAKPYAEAAGSGMHLHVSLDDTQGTNVFADDDPAGTPALRQAIGGLAATAADCMLMFAPHANSYRRYLAHSYAPVTPTWGVNNRTVALRVPTGPASSRRIEHRISGADANPYLVGAAVLAGVAHGLDHALDPGPPQIGNGYDATAAPLPVEWSEAIARTAGSPFARAQFGERFIDIHCAVKRAELRKFQREVGPQDYDWYLHTV